MATPYLYIKNPLRKLNMPITKTIGAVSYNVPITGERSWGTDTTDLLSRLATEANKVATTTFTLSNDFIIQNGTGTYGLLANFVKGYATTAVSSTGYVRLANPTSQGAESTIYNYGISWRDAGNTADLSLYPTSDTLLSFAGQALVGVSETQTLTNKTLTSPVIDTSISGSAILDEDDMVSDSDTQLATQQSIKAYVDAATGAQNEFLELQDTPASYTGEATKVPAVNVGETAVEFVGHQGISGAGTNDHAAIDSAVTASTNHIAAVTGNPHVVTHAELSDKGTNDHTAIDTHIANVTTNPHSVDSTDVGLGSVDDTSDADKPVSTATQTALDLKANIASPTFTGTVSGVTSTMVGLGSVDNTSDATKNAATVDLTNKKFADAISFDQITTPSNPVALDNKLYFKSDDSLYSLNSAGVEQEIGAGGGGSGTGEINYVTNSDAEINTADWTVGASATFESQVTDILRGSRSFRLYGTSATGTAETTIVVPEADENKLLKVSFDSKGLGVYATGDIQVVVEDVGSNELLRADVPVGQGLAQFTFASNTAGSYVLRFEIISTTVLLANALVFDNIIVGPGRTVSGAIVGAWTDVSSDFTIANITATANHLTGGTISYYNWRQVGENLEVSLEITGTDGGAGGSATDELIINLPVSGLTPVTSGEIVGVGSSRRITSDITSINAGAWAAAAIEARSTGLVMRRDETTYNSADQIVQRDFVNSSAVIKFTASVPITEWAGSGTLNIGQNDVEYYSYFDATAVTANTAFSDQTKVSRSVQGSQFANIAASSTGTTTYLIDIPGGVKETDTFSLEAKKQDGAWLTQSSNASFAGYSAQNGYQYGLSFRTSATQVEVKFGNGGRVANGATFGSAGAAWSGTDESDDYKWRIVRHSAGQPVGFGLATSDSAGLVKKNKWQTKTLSADVTSDGVLSDLTYTGLSIGRQYRFMFQLSSSVNSTDNVFTATVKDGTTTLTIARVQESLTTSIEQNGYSGTFTATGTSVTVTTSGSNSNAFPRGNGTRGETYLQIEELDNYGEETSEW